MRSRDLQVPQEQDKQTGLSRIGHLFRHGPSSEQVESKGRLVVMTTP